MNGKNSKNTPPGGFDRPRFRDTVPEIGVEKGPYPPPEVEEGVGVEPEPPVLEHPPIEPEVPTPEVQPEEVVEREAGATPEKLVTEAREVAEEDPSKAMGLLGEAQEGEGSETEE